MDLREGPTILRNGPDHSNYHVTFISHFGVQNVVLLSSRYTIGCTDRCSKTLYESITKEIMHMYVVYHTRISYRTRMVHTVRVYAYGTTVRVWYGYLYHMRIAVLLLFTSNIYH